jgi:hypothetical protein
MGRVRLWPEGPPCGVTLGRDIALAASPAVAQEMAAGTLLDDYLDADGRVAVASEARERAAAWTSARSAGLIVDGIDLTWVWGVEIYRLAALLAVRFVRGVQCAGAVLDARFECPELTAAEAAALYEAGIDVTGGGGPGAVMTPPEPVRLSRLQALAMRARVPVPQRVRGSVRVVDHWSLGPLVRAIAADGRLVPVLDPALPHSLPRRELVSLGLRGGWIGVPGPLRHLRSRRLVRRCLAALGPRRGDALDALVDERARALLAARATVTPALVGRHRRALASGRIRLVVLPFDSLATTRSVLVAAREHRVPSLLVQHGFPGEPDDPDRRESDHVATWSKRVPTPGRPATVTGNPGARTARAPRRPPSNPGRTLLLVVPPSVLSVGYDIRVGRRSIELGLNALALARPGSTVILRPHPSDPAADSYATNVSGLTVRVDRQSPIEELLAECDLCLGGVSTALLQAAAAGVPVVFVDVTVLPSTWPFDGTTDLPMAASVHELAVQIRRALAAPDVCGGDALSEALGVRTDALDQLVDLAVRLADKGR